jgi:hypothetical protein
MAWANPIFAVLDQLNVVMCQPPKGKESKDKEKDKEKEREKDGLDPVGAPGIMKEKDRDLLGSQSALHQKISTEAQLLSELEPPGGEAAPQARLAGPLEERLARLEAAVDQLQHFIRQGDRPDLGPGASSDTDDQQGRQGQ